MKLILLLFVLSNAALSTVATHPGHHGTERGLRPVRPSRCSKDDDCDRTSQYCAHGKCLAFGSCKTLKDCENPSNQYSVIFCVGTLSCDDGICCKECDTTDTTATTGCTKDDDCDPTFQYCGSDGECRAFGFCGDEKDCENPRNMYTTIGCEGVLTCNEGYCNKECTETTECPDGGRPVECLVDPCTVTPCKEPYDTCVSDYCGGCNAIFRNKNGERVCVPDASSDSSCSTDSDCNIETEYCSDGVCREHGTCDCLVDCLNPSNQYNVIMCTGYLSCKKGSCGRTCGRDGCPPGTREYNCFVQPCSVEKCDEPYEHCIDYYCDGCNAIFINASGEQVCQK